MNLNLSNAEVAAKLESHASMLRTLMATEGFMVALPRHWVESWTALKCEAAARGLQ